MVLEKARFLSAFQDGTSEGNGTSVMSSEGFNIFLRNGPKEKIVPNHLQTGFGYQNVLILEIRNHLLLFSS